MSQASIVRHVPHEHCFTCNKQTATKACGGCGVATYCNATCAKAGWKEHKHRETCADYSRIVALASGLPMGGRFGHLDTPEERAGFDHFRAEADDADDAVPPLTDLDALLDAIWAALTDKMRAEWDKKAGRRDFPSGRTAFDAERRRVVADDLKESYPKDSRAKQVWRNLVKAERAAHMKSAAAGPSAGPKKRARGERGDADADATVKRQRLVMEVLQDHLSTIPTELTMAILNDLPQESILAVAGANKHLNAIAWQVFYTVDIVPYLNRTEWGPALLRKLSGEATYKRKFELAWEHIAAKARPLAELLVTNRHGDDERGEPDSRRFMLVNGNDMAHPILVGKDGDISDVMDEYSDLADINQRVSRDFLLQLNANRRLISRADMQSRVMAHLSTYGSWIRRREVVQMWGNEPDTEVVLEGLFDAITLVDGVSVRPASGLIASDAKLRRLYVTMRDTLRAYRFSLGSKPATEEQCIDAVTRFLVALMIRHGMRLVLYVAAFEDSVYWEEYEIPNWNVAFGGPFVLTSLSAEEGVYEEDPNSHPDALGPGIKYLYNPAAGRAYWDTDSLIGPDEEAGY